MEEPDTGMTVSVVDIFRIDDEGNHVDEPVATFADYDLQDGATAEFLELWRNRPRALARSFCMRQDDYLVRYCITHTLEDDPVGYFVALYG